MSKEAKKVTKRRFLGVEEKDAKSKFGKRLAKKHLEAYIKGKKVFKFKTDGCHRTIFCYVKEQYYVVSV